MTMTAQSIHTWRLTTFFGIFFAMTIWEIFLPRRSLTKSKLKRWTSNLLLVVLDSVLLRFIVPAGAVGLAWMARDRHWGLLNHLYALSPTAKIIVTVITLDAVIYAQHYVFHHVPLFWRFHKVHHADLDFDVTTGIRFHPLEILVSMGIKFVAIALIGASPLGVLWFEIILNGTSLFNHSNIVIPRQIDRFLRFVLVTPDMHRVHHSVVVRETNSNFSFNLSLWDHIFGTYRAQPSEGHQKMTIGLPQFQKKSAIEFSRMLLMPFKH